VPWAAGRDDERCRIRDHRVDQLDLDPDHRVDPGCLRCGGEPDGPVQALVIGDREPGEPKHGRPRDEIVGGGCPVEEREVAVAVQLGVGGWGHGGLRGWTGMIEQMF